MITAPKNIKPTKELNDIIQVISSVAASKYRTVSVTSDYFIYAFLTQKKCSAYQILETQISPSEEIALVDSISKSLIVHSQSTWDFTKSTSYSEEMSNFFDAAIEESKKDNAEFISSVHILLAMLDDKKNNSVKKSLQKYGITYEKVSEKYRKAPLETIKKGKSEKSSSVNSVKKTPYIDEFTENINEQCATDKFGEIVVREKEVNFLIKTLARKDKNNAIIVGEAGVGKTSIVNCLAQLINKNEVPRFLRGKKILKLNHVSLVSGTTYRGMIEERATKLFSELKSSGEYILLLDDMQNMFKHAGKEKDGDLSGIISDILNDGAVRVIGTIGIKDYRNVVELNPFICRKFQKIMVEKPEDDILDRILKSASNVYGDYYNVKYSDKVIKLSSSMAERYFTERMLPDSAIDIIDVAGATAFAKRECPEDINELERSIGISESKMASLKMQHDASGSNKALIDINDLKAQLQKKYKEYEKYLKEHKTDITEEDILNAVSEITTIPVSKLTSDEKEKIKKLPETLKKSIIGQDEAIDSVCRMVKRGRAGLGNPNKPICVVLCVGPTGVGKSFLAKKLAEEMFGSEDAIVRVDMSEYSEKSSVGRLIGASPGYIGYEDGGYLTESVKTKKHCIVLLDEIEKANEEVHNVFLQLFDEGRLTDGAGQTVNFRNTIVMMTSNVGARNASDFGEGIGFSRNVNDLKQSIVEKDLKKTFKPEFINRIDGILYFNPLSEEQLRKIANKKIDEVASLLSLQGLEVNFDESVINRVMDSTSDDRKYGARPILRAVQTEVEDNLTDYILGEESSENKCVSMRYDTEKGMVIENANTSKTE